VEEWLFAWGIAFLTMLPLVVFVAPFIQRCVLALTVSPVGDGLNGRDICKPQQSPALA